MILAQMANNIRLRFLFRELLSNKGNEVFMKAADLFGEIREMEVRDLRMLAMRNGYTLLGYLKRDKKSRAVPCLNPDPDDTVTLGENDSLIVIGRK